MAFKMEGELYLTLGEVGELLQQSPVWVTQVVDANMLRTRRIRGRRRVSWTMLLDFMEDQEIPMPLVLELVTRLAGVLADWQNSQSSSPTRPTRLKASSSGPAGAPTQKSSC